MLTKTVGFNKWLGRAPGTTRPLESTVDNNVVMACFALSCE